MLAWVYFIGMFEYRLNSIVSGNDIFKPTRTDYIYIYLYLQILGIARNPKLKTFLNTLHYILRIVFVQSNVLA